MSNIKAYIEPKPEASPYGIRRVIDAMHKHLPDFGVEVTNSPKDADVVNCHAMTRVEAPGKPLVFSSHGFMWSDHQWPDEYLRANQYMIDTMVQAQAVTAPSQWVAHAISRGIMHRPVVAYHGVDADEWQPGTNGNYVLWNKARADVVSDPADMQRLAAIMHGVTFVTTIGNKVQNVHVLGVQPYEKMRPIVANAGVYLATARETMGIGTLEALSCGIPVAGWNHGGQREIIVQGETGYLAPYGDYEALQECVQRCFVERDRLSANARHDAITRWSWPDKIAVYADLFKQVVNEWTMERPRVSIIITSHNLAKYLPFALESVQQQTLTDWECLIVDDASTDNTGSIGRSWEQLDGRFKYLPTPRNLKLSGARNYGFSHSSGRYIIPLDADDLLAANALRTLSEALDANPAVHIAYGHLDLISEDGTGQRRGGEGQPKDKQWPYTFDWRGLTAHINQQPYSSMMRREVLERGGGYRSRDWRAEDASMWMRVTAYGFRAQKVTEESTLIYRLRSDSKGSLERQQYRDNDGDWTAWYPWRLGAKNAQEGERLVLSGKQQVAAVVPFGAQGKPAKAECWPVWSHHDPLISIIIPCGPAHAHLVIDALDSVQAQTFPFWQAIVVNDTGKELANLPAWATAVAGGGGVAASRNIGIQNATAPLILFLDADDILLPYALKDMLTAWIDNQGSKYIYADWYNVWVDGKTTHEQCRPYDRKETKPVHPISILVKREHALAVGMFDPSMKGLEDWDFFTKLKVAGFCGEWLQKPLLVYRTETGARRNESLDAKDEIDDEMARRYGAFFNGQREMRMCCGSDNNTVLEAKRYLGMIVESKGENRMMENDNGMIRLEFIGLNEGAVPYKSISGKQLSKVYRLGNNPLYRYADATKEDAAILITAGLCKAAKTDPGIDLSQAAVPQFEMPAFVPYATNGDTAQYNQPVQQSTKRQLTDPGTMNLATLRQYLIGLSADSLRELLAMETAGQNRKGAISSIELILEDVERVHAPMAA